MFQALHTMNYSNTDADTDIHIRAGIQKYLNDIIQTIQDQYQELHFGKQNLTEPLLAEFVPTNGGTFYQYKIKDHYQKEIDNFTHE